MKYRSTHGSPNFLIITILILILCNSFCFAQSNSIHPIYEKYSFSYNQIPDPLTSQVSNIPGSTFQWYSSPTPDEASFTPIPGAQAEIYNFSQPLINTTYFKRLSIPDNTFSNIIELSLVSVDWENINYVREHDLLISGQTDWKLIDQLPIGQKLQTTTYMDGLGRTLQKISKGTATPSSSNDPWGDAVQFNRYDNLGRQQVNYLPYTTLTEAGKYKTLPLGEQPAYYITKYNETEAYSFATFDNSPENRVLNVKGPGTLWAASAGNSNALELNTTADNVKYFTIGYLSTDIPQTTTTYLPNTLIKTKSTGVNGKQVITYTNFFGQTILTKTQIGDYPGQDHAGWICVYNIYDDFGQLRYQVQPEAVNYLDTHGWVFAGTEGQDVIKNLCFRYIYDEKGRVVSKKAPGAEELLMLYDKRDRVVFMQDGNQRVKSPAEFTTNIYDDLDRPLATLLYQTTKTAVDLQADIDAASLATQPITISSQGITLNAYLNPLSAATLNNSGITTIVKFNFYDDYSFPGVKPFNTNFKNLQAYLTGGETIAASQRTTGMLTGTRVRVLSTTTYLNSTMYVDDEGRSLQVSEDNIKTGTDVTTLQYQWDGRLLSSHTIHNAPGTDYTNFDIITKNSFDKLGRTTGIEKKYGSNPFQPIAGYAFDDMGRLKSKTLDPLYNNGAGLETLAYNYNIQNAITGINKDYALKAGFYNKWQHYFGMYLGYDNKDNVFAKSELDGHVTGILWSTQGDDAQRRYDFSYDNAGRFISAAFTEKEKPYDGWNTGKMDISVGGNGAGNGIIYDLNGNIKNMWQKTRMPGATSAAFVDNLSYTYSAFSNKLLRVTDNGTLGSSNGKLSDFADGTNSGDDYIYDDNGNLVIDLNKNAVNANGGISTPLGTAGIKYNYLDKPELINIAGKGTIQIIYDALGNRLQRTYTPETGGTAKTTTYINEFVYEGASLQYINFEEGRLRVMQQTTQDNGFDLLSIDGNIDLPASKKGAYDYFVRDYQSNVRMILTEETHLGRNVCTMETARATNEEPIFGQQGQTGPSGGGVGQQGPANEVILTRFTKPSGWSSNTSSKVSRLLAPSQGSPTGNYMIGPNVLLKVMAGDQISTQAGYYYQNPVSRDQTTSVLNSLLQALIGTISGSNVTSGITKSSAAGIGSNLGNDINFTPLPFGGGPSNFYAPQAYLAVLFFDERFNFVGEGSVSKQVQQPGDHAPDLNIVGALAPKNGYAYVYVCNQSQSEPVYFDNIQVTQQHSAILEEDHYYAFGLKIAGISSKKLPDPAEGGIKNNNLYNDKELWDEADLNWYDYGFRNYDPQIGRFPQLDPLTWDYTYQTPYQYADCDPIANIDLDGLEGFNALQTLGNVTVTAVRHTAPTALSVTGSFLKGVGSSLLGTVAGIASAVAHPINTAKGLANVVAHPINTAKALYNVGKQAINDFENGNADKRANMLGHAVGDIAQIFIGTEELKVAEELITAAKTTEKAIVIGEDMNRVRKYAGKTHDYWKGWEEGASVEKNLSNNMKAVEQWKKEGREIIDIGPDFKGRSRTINPRKTTNKGNSFYNGERQGTKGYKNYKKDFQRTSKKTGGNNSIDF